MQRTVNQGLNVVAGCPDVSCTCGGGSSGSPGTGISRHRHLGRTTTTTNSWAGSTDRDTRVAKHTAQCKLCIGCRRRHSLIMYGIMNNVVESGGRAKHAVQPAQVFHHRLQQQDRQTAWHWMWSTGCWTLLSSMHS